MLAALLVIVQASISVPAHAQPQTQAFVISDIRVEGLQRISAGSVFAALPVGVGDVVNEYALRQAVRSLFVTGNFDDIRIGRDGNVLVVMVTERPSISEINIDGNKAIETEALLEGLKGAGLAVGQVFQRSTLEGMQLELQRQYVQQGRYDASIETEVLPEPRNRVSINIDVDEGSVATIEHINAIKPVGHYALQLVFDDGHDTGLYAWDYLHDLCTHQEARWQDYLNRMEAAGAQRDPDVQVVQFQP